MSERQNIIAEVRVRAEGSFRHVQASGSGRTWATAASPISGIFGFAESFSFTSAYTLFTPKDRGIPDHHKMASKDPIQVTVNTLWTGGVISAATASGASLPMIHLEFRASALETPATGVYYQFHGVPLNSIQMTENEQGNTQQYTFTCLAMNGPTASGYLS